jgi:hypothetical protein
LGTVVNGNSNIAKRSNYITKESSDSLLGKYLRETVKKMGIKNIIFTNVIHTIMSGILSKETFRNKNKKAIVLVVINVVYTFNDEYLDYLDCAKMLDLSLKCVTKASRIVNNCIHMHFPEYKEMLIPKQTTDELIIKYDLSKYTETYKKLLEYTSKKGQVDIIGSTSRVIEIGVLWYILKNVSHEYTITEYTQKFDIEIQKLQKVVCSIDNTRLHEREALKESRVS